MTEPSAAQPGSPASPVPATEPPGLDIQEFSPRKRLWQVFIFDDHLRFRTQGEPDHIVMRSDAPRLLSLHETGALRGMVWLRLKKAVTYKPDPELFQRLREWAGPVTGAHLKVELDRWLPITLPWAVLCAVGFTLGRRSDLPSFRIDLVVAAVLFGATMLGKVQPHRIYFLLGSLAFSILAVGNVVARVPARQWAAAAIFTMIYVLLAWGGWRRFQRFAGVKAQP